MNRWSQIWIVAMARNAAKQAARRAHRATTRRLRLPDPLRELCPDAPGAELLAQGVGLIPVIGGDDLGPLPRASTPAGSAVDRVQPRPAGRLGATVAAEAWTWAALGHARTAACARGHKRPPRPRPAREAARVPRRSPGGARA